MKHGKTAEGNVPNLTSAGPFWMQGTSSASSLNAGAPKEPGSATAVSYTHLDVYKRQALTLEIRPDEAIMSHFQLLTCAAAASLLMGCASAPAVREAVNPQEDVYKRQAPDCGAAEIDRETLRQRLAVPPADGVMHRLAVHLG